MDCDNNDDIEAMDTQNDPVYTEGKQLQLGQYLKNLDSSSDWNVHHNANLQQNYDKIMYIFQKQKIKPALRRRFHFELRTLAR